MSKFKYSDDEFSAIVKNSISVRGALATMGLKEAGGNYRTFHARIKKLNIDTSHFTGQAYLKGKTHNWNKKSTLEEILIEGSSYKSSELRVRLIKENVFLNECSRCHLTEWMGDKISLHLDHINGDNTNNKLENLRILCPNCHSQTPTYCRRKK